MKRTILALLMAVLMLSAVGCGSEPAVTPEPAPTPGEATGLDGEAILNAKCGSCHSIDTVLAEENDAVGWAAVIDDMITRGAQLTDDEATALAEYLSLQ